jgi:hypothetical protein
MFIAVLTLVTAGHAQRIGDDQSIRPLRILKCRLAATRWPERESIN